MDVHAELVAPCTPEQLFALVEDLSTYPSWLDMVHRAERIAGATERWTVDLRARLGPLARSKRLQMERTEHDPAACRARFERRETDGRRHSPWVLRVEVAEQPGGSRLSMHLHYGGSLWTGGVLERVLSDQITKGRERLLQRVQPTH